MSDWITWESCPRCGSRAAIGWVSIEPADGGPARDVRVEFDCSRGCRWDPSAVHRWVTGDAEARPGTTGPGLDER